MGKLLNITWDIDESAYPSATADIKLALFHLRRMQAEYVWDITHLEGNPYNFVEVQTLLQGTTVGNHTLFDQTQVLNQAKSLDELRAVIEQGDTEFSKALLLRYHHLVANDEALKWGVFRDGQVSISGTDYMPPQALELDGIFEQGVAELERIAHPFERALAYFFFGALNQFFYDGNKRTSRLVMNTILLQNGYFYLSIPGDRKDEFDQVMVDFYNSKNATNGFRLLMDCYRDLSQPVPTGKM